MLKKHDIPGGDDGELHREHLAAGGHPGGWNGLSPKGDVVLDGLTIHQVRGPFDLDDSLVSANSVVAALGVDAEGEVGGVTKEEVADRTVNETWRD